MIDFSKFELLKPDPAEILERRETGVIYCADFGNGKGRYISVSLDGESQYDVGIKVSPKIELRLTYIFDKKEVTGVQLTKLDSRGNLDSIHLSTLDWEGVLTILHIFSEMDLSSVANKSIVIEGGLEQDPEALKRFLSTVAADPDGREKMKEILKNFNAIKIGDINEAVERSKTLTDFEKVLNDEDEFKRYKKNLDVGKDEEVWQTILEANPWILGSDVVEILEERVLDEDNITDIPVKDIDGFVNIVELKLPEEEVWTKELNPTANLTKAIMQCMRYITETERRMNDHKKIGKLKANILKPRITLIFGRSNDWDDSHREQFKILNSSYHNISILTYDHVLRRAQQVTHSSSE